MRKQIIFESEGPALMELKKHTRAKLERVETWQQTGTKEKPGPQRKVVKWMLTTYNRDKVLA